MTSDHAYSTGFNWDQLVTMPIASEEWHKGRQVLNFYPMDKDYRDSPEARAVGIGLGQLVYLLHGKLRHVGMRNLEMVFPEKSLRERRRIVRGVSSWAPIPRTCTR